MSQTPTCTVNYLCVGALLVFVGSILLCTLGFTVILPYESTRSWTQVTCTVVNASYNKHLCSCQRSLTDYEPCNSKYPCIQVYVAYTPVVQAPSVSVKPLERNINTRFPDSNNDTTPALMVDPSTASSDNTSSSGARVTTESQLTVEDENITFMKHNLVEEESTNEFSSTTEVPTTTTLLYRSWSDAFYKKCSLQECSDEEWNYKQTSDFHKSWGQTDESFPCYHDPDEPDLVVATRTSFSAMLQAVLWSCSCLALGAVVWIGLCCGICSMEVSGSEADERLMGAKPLPA